MAKDVSAIHVEQQHDVTVLLNRVADGEDDARAALMERVYDGLRRIAQNRMKSERPGHTLQATELVHEAYLKLADEIGNHPWSDRAHFYHAAAEAMRRILVDHARKRGRLKRGSGPIRIGLNVVDLAQAEDNAECIFALHEAFERLENLDGRLAQVVRLRFFAGLSVEDTASAMGVSKRTVMRDWSFARAWLLREMGRQSG